MILLTDLGSIGEHRLKEDSEFHLGYNELRYLMVRRSGLTQLPVKGEGHKHAIQTET